MGYTITIRPRNPALGQEMLAFCKEHVRPLPEVMGDYNLFEIRGLLPGPQLSYCKRPTHIGFDYGPGMIERDWCYRLLQWMAVKVGVRKKGLPCYLYDGQDWFSLHPSKFDALGQARPKHRGLVNGWLFSPEGSYKPMTKEIKRLDKLWEAFHNPRKETWK